MKNFYLTGLVVLLIVILVMYFENLQMAGGMQIQFLGSRMTFYTMYWLMMFLGIGFGTLVTLYIQETMHDIQNRSANNFDL